MIDGYAGKEQLEHEFGFDNKVFLDSLRSLGFQFPKISRSNYPRTEFSMASMLNMSYDTLKDHKVTIGSLKYCSERISRNQVVSVFKDLGYTFVNNSIFDIHGEGSPVSNSFLLNGQDRIERATLAGRIENDIYIQYLATHYPGSNQYKKYIYEPYRTDSVLEKRLLNNRWRGKTPVFVYSHFLYTHFPYYFRDTEKFNSDKDIQLTNYERKDLYLANLKAINPRILRDLHSILASSSKPPVIILISDHGFRYGSIPYWDLSNLAAFYIPDKKEFLPDTLTNVNVFPALLNNIWNQNYPLLPNK